MSKEWQLQEAKARFSEVVRRATNEGPQVVTVRGEPAAVVVSARDFRRLDRAHPTFAEHLLAGPKVDDEAAAQLGFRAPDPGRAVEL